MVMNAGTHPAALGQVNDVETTVTLSVSCLVQTKALMLSDAFDALFLCVSHGAHLLILKTCSNIGLSDPSMWARNPIVIGRAPYPHDRSMRNISSHSDDVLAPDGGSNSDQRYSFFIFRL